MRGMLLILTIVAALPAAAHAGDDDSPRSEDTAFWWSAGGTLASAGLLGAGAVMYVAFDPNSDNPPRLLKVPLHNWGNGLIATGIISSTLTPSLGQWYSHRFFTGGMGLRAAGLLAIALGSAASTCIDPADLDCHPGNGTGLYVVGGLLYGGGVLYDLATARGAAREYNAKHAAHVALAPSRVGRGYGLVLGGSF